MKQADALTIARKVFPEMDDTELSAILWHRTSYPFVAGDNPLEKLENQLKEYKQHLEDKAMDETALIINRSEVESLKNEVEWLRGLIRDVVAGADRDAYGYYIIELAQDGYDRLCDAQVSPNQSTTNESEAQS